MNRLADAALELMEESGTEGTTIAAVVERAGSSVGSFYARFPGKEELIRYVRAQVWADARDRWDQALEAEAWDGLPLPALLESVVGLLLRSFRADFQRRKVLKRGLASDPEAARQLLDFHQHLLLTVTPLILSRKEEVSHPQPEEAAEFGYRCVVGAIREFLEMEAAEGAFGPASPKPVGELGPKLALLWLGQLDPGGTPRAGPSEGDVDFFDPWG
jgi:AcrR family transcriptional regulator